MNGIRPLLASGIGDRILKLASTVMQVLTDQEMEQIWQAALRVWDQAPLRAQSAEEFNEALLDFGCQVNDEQIRCPKAVQEKVRARIADSREQLWSPELMDRRVPMAWVREPRTMLENARVQARKFLAEAANKCLLSAQQQAEVKSVVAEADVLVGAAKRM